MKVALCLSGHFRSFNTTFKSLQDSIIGPYQPDIFIYSPETLGFDGADRGDHHLVKSNLDIEKIKELYKPKKILVEPLRKWDVTKYYVIPNIGLRDPEIVCGMFYGIYKANQLKMEFEEENNFTYDVVIRCRPDLYFENTLRADEVHSAAKSTGVYIPNFGSYGGLNDQFSFGHSKIMDIFCATFPNLDKFYDLGCKWHAETMTKFTADYFNIPILRSNIEYFLLRANGQVFRLARDT